MFTATMNTTHFRNGLKCNFSPRYLVYRADIVVYVIYFIVVITNFVINNIVVIIVATAVVAYGRVCVGLQYLPCRRCGAVYRLRVDRSLYPVANMAAFWDVCGMCCDVSGRGDSAAALSTGGRV